MDYKLLAKYIFNEANETERQTVQRWLREKDQHQQELEHILHQVEIAAKRYKHERFDARRAAKKIAFTSEKHSLRTWPITAAIVVLFIGIWFWTEPRSENLTFTTHSGETKEFYLPDSSRVTLTGNSTLICNQGYGKTQRETTLKGKAFFEVNRNINKSFIVNTSILQVEVLGTSFQIVVNDEKAEVMVEKGRVKVSPKEEIQEKILEAGMSAIYEIINKKLEVFKDFNVNLLSWKTGNFKFDNTPLNEVIPLLNEYYGSHIIVPEAYTLLRITVEFQQVSLNEAIEIINKTLDIQLKP